MDDLEKLSQAVFPLFHGIVAAYLFRMLTDIEIDEISFAVLVLFFAFINVAFSRIMVASINFIRLIVNDVMFCLNATTNTEQQDVERKDIVRSIYSAFSMDLKVIFALPHFVYAVLLTVSAIICGISSAYLYEDDFLLNSASRFEDWSKASNKDVLEEFFSNFCNRNNHPCKERDINGIVHDNPRPTYVRIWWKDTKMITAGWLKEVPNDRKRNIVQLIDSCELSVDLSNTASPIQLKAIDRKAQTFSTYVDLLSPNVLFFDAVGGENPCQG